MKLRCANVVKLPRLWRRPPHQAIQIPKRRCGWSPADVIKPFLQANAIERDERAVTGWPGHSGGLSLAAVSPCVKTKSRSGESGPVNSSTCFRRRPVRPERQSFRGGEWHARSLRNYPQKASCHQSEISRSCACANLPMRLRYPCRPRPRHATEGGNNARIIISSVRLGALSRLPVHNRLGGRTGSNAVIPGRHKRCPA
jgi:hypothetical protein